MADDTFAEKLAHWRKHGLQVATGGMRPTIERVTTAPDGHTIREVFDKETRSSAYHHSNDDSRQDVTVRPDTAHLTLKGN